MVQALQKSLSLALNVVQNRKLELCNATTQFKKSCDVVVEYVVDNDTVIAEPVEGQEWKTIKFSAQFSLKKEDLLHTDLKLELEIDKGIIVPI